MIITKTPFRLSLGGGSTDLPSYYEKYGGFIFGCAINMYFNIFLTTPVVDEKIRMRYSSYESVDSPEDLKHHIGREAFRLTNITQKTDITFQSDTPAGTGLGSSGSCAVGLLNALHVSKGELVSKEQLASEAFQVTKNLGWPDGPQDPYIAALGGFVVLDIYSDGIINWYRPSIKSETIRRFLQNTLLFYTGVKRPSVSILCEQNTVKALELKHQTKKIGKQILDSFVFGDLEKYGKLMHEHWLIKREMSEKMSSGELDGIYDAAINAGALGGKIIGAGGGGYFMFYCPDDKIKSVSSLLENFGLKKVFFDIDYYGTRFVNFSS